MRVRHRLSTHARKPLCKTSLQFSQALPVVQVLHVAEVSEVERDVIIGLRDQNDVATKGMSNADLVEHVRVAAGAVADHYRRLVYQ